MNTHLLKKASLIAMAALMIAPVATQASSTKGMNACIETFVKEHVPAGHTVRIVKRARFEVPFIGFGGREAYLVSAKGAQTGESFGSAECVVDRKGSVLAMHIQDSPVRLAKDGGSAQQASGG